MWLFGYLVWALLYLDERASLQVFWNIGWNDNLSGMEEENGI